MAERPTAERVLEEIDALCDRGDHEDTIGAVQRLIAAVRAATRKGDV
jgi:hypothetical protein